MNLVLCGVIRLVSYRFIILLVNLLGGTYEPGIMWSDSIGQLQVHYFTCESPWGHL